MSQLQARFVSTVRFIGVIGWDDFGIFVQIIFELVLINMAAMEEYTKLKDKGNELFKEKKFGDAIQTFKTGINRVVSEQAKDQLNSQTEVGKLYVILNINAAFAALNQKTKDAYQLAEQFCNVALEIDSNNQKGLYRRALANKELAQLIEIESKGNSEQLLALYGKAKKDLEDLIILDRGNEIAKQKLSEVVKNIYRVTVTQGKEVNLSGGAKVEEVSEKREHKTQAEQPKPAVRSRNGADMNKILKDYKVEEVITLARQKVQHQYLSQQLPKTRAELEKAIRQIEKSKGVFLKFIYRMTDNYLKDIKPTFDMLLQMVAIVLELGEGEEAKNAMVTIKNQKAFDLLWKGYNKDEKSRFKSKWQALGLNVGELK